MSLGLANQHQAGEMAQLLGSLAALPGDPDLIPNTHTVAHNSATPIPRGLTPSSGLCGHQACMFVFMCECVPICLRNSLEPQVWMVVSNHVLKSAQILRKSNESA